ncbi:MAG: hypothetical protein JG770_321 [Mahella sp.]|nr:hypothetical protein [Mahella sp.]
MSDHRKVNGYYTHEFKELVLNMNIPASESQLIRYKEPSIPNMRVTDSKNSVRC